MSAATNRREKMIYVGPSAQPAPPPFRPLGSFSGQMIGTYNDPILTHQDLANIIAGMDDQELAKFIQVLGRRLTGTDQTRLLALSDPGPKRITIIKIIREATGLKLIDAKRMVDSAPVNIMIADAWTIETVASRLR